MVMEGKAWFNKDEVAQHNVPSDCWVSYFGKVYDLTSLIRENEGPLIEPILKFAGKDISHWFDEKSRQPKTCIDPRLNVRMPFTPYGRYLHIPPPEPSTSWASDFGKPWWSDDKYHTGFLSKKKRKIRIINQLTSQEHLLEICSEETLTAIRERYLKYNKHAHSYTWKRLGRPLNMSKTLEENGIPDQAEEFTQLGIDEDEYIPAVHIYFNDDLTVA